MKKRGPEAFRLLPFAVGPEPFTLNRAAWARCELLCFSFSFATLRETFSTRNAIAARLHETRLRRSLQRISRKVAKAQRKTTGGKVRLFSARTSPAGVIPEGEDGSRLASCLLFL
jgi:hypothetical protein